MPEETKDLNTAGKAASEVLDHTGKKKGTTGYRLGCFFKILLVLVCVTVAAGLLTAMLLNFGSGGTGAEVSVPDVSIMDKFDMFMTNEVSHALDGVLEIEKVYWLSDTDLVAPKPNPANYGTADSPEELMWLLEEAKNLIGDQEMLFNENTPVWDGDKIYYYYDETILVITWKQPVDRGMYTISEVKIAHPSQFRRFLAGGQYGSDKQFITTEMADTVNAVVASSGDFYKYRYFGSVVYEGQLRRHEGVYVDTCFINESGDLLFAYRGELLEEQQARRFVEDNHVRFSLTFGPVLVDNGVACPPELYALGQTNDRYARAALCQKDDLHYLLVSACGEPKHQNRHTIAEFADNVAEFGVQKAYALDGGQTTVIAMSGRTINSVEHGYQRAISDIIYFATALPDGE